MANYRQAPTFDTPIMVGKSTSATWYRWIQSTDQGIPPSNESSVILTGSPFTYTAPSKGFVIVEAGTVSSIVFSRSSNYLTGLTQGIFPLSQGDKLTISYSGLPAVTWVPQ